MQEKPKLGKGENQLVQQANHFGQNAATCHIPIAAGIIDTVLD
jgi:hypothetical protein